MKKNLRYLILLLILLFVVLNETLVNLRVTSWENTLSLRIYAVNGDGRPVTERYIRSLESHNFEAIEKYINREARRFGVDIDALDVEFNGSLETGPPQPPSGRIILENIWWSLKFRAWAARRSWGHDGDDGDIQLYVNYYDTRTTQALRHSVGLEGGKIGIINAFADPAYHGSNQVVITHEFLHTLGAKDKYDANNSPIFPQGYAEPHREPLYPQLMAEIMGGRIPLTQHQLAMPESLNQTVIGGYTAAEINWPGFDP